MAKRKKVIRSIASVMSHGVHTLKPSATLHEAAKLMAKKHISCVIITNNNKPLGILTERDYIQKVVLHKKDPQKTKVKSIMSFPVRYITEDTDLISVYNLMRKHKMRRFPVVDKKAKLIGIVTQRDIIDGLIEIVKDLDWKHVKTKIMIEDLYEHYEKL